MNNYAGYKRFYKLYKSAEQIDIIKKHRYNAFKLWVLSIVDISIAKQYYKAQQVVTEHRMSFGFVYTFDSRFKSAVRRELSVLRKKSPLHRIKMSMRTRLSSYCRKIQVDKNFKTMDALGCTSLELKQHLELKFTEGMNWDSYGKWHVDHIKPISLATTEQEAIQLSHYTNLQPLWAEDNLKKSNKYE